MVGGSFCRTGAEDPVAYINTDGDVVLDVSQYAYADSFTYGLAWVYESEDSEGFPKNSYFINQSGKKAIDVSQYDYVEPYSGGLAKVANTRGDSYYGFMDTNGNIVLEVPPNDWVMYNSFGEGLAYALHLPSGGTMKSYLLSLDGYQSVETEVVEETLLEAEKPVFDSVYGSDNGPRLFGTVTNGEAESAYGRWAVICVSDTRGMTDVTIMEYTLEANESREVSLYTSSISASNGVSLRYSDIDAKIISVNLIDDADYQQFLSDLASIDFDLTSGSSYNLEGNTRYSATSFEYNELANNWVTSTFGLTF